MTDARRTGTSFADDIDEFDLLLQDDDAAPAASARVSARSGRTGSMAAARAAGAGRGEAAAASARQLRSRIRITPDWNRIAAVLFVAIVVLFVVYFAVTSLLDARRNGAYKDYFGEVREISTQSDAHGDELASILTDVEVGDRSQRLARMEQLGEQADKLVVEARQLEVPEQLAESHTWMLTSLEYRARGVEALQGALTRAIDTKDKQQAAQGMAAAAARLLASDVIWSDSYMHVAKGVLTRDEATEVTVPTSTFLGHREWTSPTAMQKMLVRLQTAGAATKGGTVAAPKDGKVRGGQLEGGQLSVSPSGQTLALNALTEIKGGDSVVFEIPFTNQGEVQLTDVPVKVTLRGDSSDPIELTGSIDVVDPGQTAVAKVPLDSIPTFGEVLDMEVLVGPIPGEKTEDNNRATYKVQISL